MMEVWVSEQSLCTIVDINNQCGPQAADFYTDLQVNVFTPEYPVVCKAPGYNPDSTEGSTLNGNSVLEQTAPPMIASTLPTTTVSYIIFSNFIFETTTTSKNYLETLMDEPFISLPPTFNASTTLPPSKPTVTSGSRPYSSLVGTVKLTSDRNTIGVRVEKGKNKEDLKYRSDGCQVNQYLLLVIITVISSLWSTK